MPRTVQELANRLQDLKHEQKKISEELASALFTYKGTVLDAVAEGMVKLNFMAPRGFYEEVRNRKTPIDFDRENRKEAIHGKR